MVYVVLCPGSRSSPLAVAAGKLARDGKLRLITSIDERSAAFLAVGLSVSTDKASIVITTSGTAVANLLPAAVEADRSCIPILFLTADRPSRLKNCGANQTVNQEDFLQAACRKTFQASPKGIHLISSQDLSFLVNRTWSHAHDFPGPVHLNIAIEEPLHSSSKEQDEILFEFDSFEPLNLQSKGNKFQKIQKGKLPILDFSRPGIIVAGPWRGSNKNLLEFKKGLEEFFELTGWPLLADPLSGLTSEQPGLISNWEILLPFGLPIPLEGLEVLRLGPMPSSRNIEIWLRTLGDKQVLISEGDSRKMDPLSLSMQWDSGLISWLEAIKKKKIFNNKIHQKEKENFFREWYSNDEIAEDWLNKKLSLKGVITEPALARCLPRLLPGNYPIMLSSSSPVRDWLTFSGIRHSSSRCFGFRGASGIDGTLSIGMGLAIANEKTILITGDLALLHDSNGWLFNYSESPKLIVLLIDNGGGGIFQQLGIETSLEEDLERLFVMPQKTDHLSLASSHGISNRQISCFEDLENAIEWSLSQSGTVLLRVSTHPKQDQILREEIRQGLHKLIGIESQKNPF